MTIGSALRHHWPWVVVTLVVALLVAGAVAHERKPTYQATALLQVDAAGAVTEGSIDVTTQETRATNTVQVIEGTPFLTGVCKAESKKGVSCSPRGLQSQMSLNLVKSTTLLAITISAPRADWAASLANAIATAAIQERTQEARHFYQQSIDTREGQANQVARQIAQAEQQISSIAGNAAIPAGQQTGATAPFVAQLDILQGRYSALLATQESLEEAQLQAERTVVVAQRATVPSQPAAPSLKHYLAAGAGAGLVLGFLLVMVAARLDRRVRSGQRLAAAAGVPFVVELPRGRSLPETEEACVPAVSGLLGRRPEARTVLLVPTGAPTETHAVAALVGHVLGTFGREARVVVEGGRTTPLTVLAALPGPNQGPPPTGQSGVVVFGTASPGQSALAMLLAPRVDLVVLVASEPEARVGAVERAAALLRHAGADIAAGVLIRGQGRFPLPAPESAPEPAVESA